MRKELFGTLFLLLFLISVGSNGQNYVQAEPRSGISATKFFLQQHLEYPPDLLAKSKSGNVKISMDIDKNGNGSNYHVISSFNGNASAEAIRLAKKILWNPATMNGIAIKDEAEILVKFNARQYKRQLQKPRQTNDIKIEYPVARSGLIFKFAAVDRAPKPFITSEKNIYQYINDQIKYPEQAFALNIEGDVELEFVVEENGLPSNIYIQKSVGGGCDNEAIRILQTIPWIPAVANDSIVRCHTNLKISFRLGDKKQQSIPNRQGSSF